MEVGLFVAVEKEREEKRKGETWREEGPAKPNQASAQPPSQEEGKGGTGEKVGRCGEDR